MFRLFFLFLFLCCLSGPVAGAEKPIGLIRLDGAIGPVSANYLRLNLQQAPFRGEQLVMIQIDTPGGLDTAMRDCVRSIFSSPVPVAVFVGPAGARAASAGAIITLSAHIAAMAPGTNIGAAHPVTMGQKPDKVMMEKMVNDAVAYAEGIARLKGRNVEQARRMVKDSASFSAEDALKVGVVDLLAANPAELLRQLEGRQFNRNGTVVTLRTAGAQLTFHDMGKGEKILNVIADPNIAYVLMVLGMLGIFFELSTPGVILPGVIGAISLILAFFGMQALPVNYAGVLLILLAMVLFIAETQVVSHGILGIGGIAALVLGSLILFPSPEPWLRVSRTLIATTATVAGLCIAFVVNRALSVHRRKPVSGAEGLVGEAGLAETDLMLDGKVAVHGEYWNATANEPVVNGERVTVVAVEGLRLRVKKG